LEWFDHLTPRLVVVNNRTYDEGDVNGSRSVMQQNITHSPIRRINSKLNTSRSEGMLKNSPIRFLNKGSPKRPNIRSVPPSYKSNRFLTKKPEVQAYIDSANLVVRNRRNPSGCSAGSRSNIAGGEDNEQSHNLC